MMHTEYTEGHLAGVDSVRTGVWKEKSQRPLSADKELASRLGTRDNGKRLMLTMQVQGLVNDDSIL